MQLQTVKVSACYESETNPRGKDFEGVAFKELVASVKEKGVLVPVLVRPRTKAGKEFEVVAGSRRLRAAKEAGLASIPAMVEQMDDTQAREAQIIENLQRQDVHPLEEGEAYRQLIEASSHSVKDVAAKVGKSETYVRNRLFLTNLAEPAAKAYRSGQISDSFAVVIARLAPAAQTTTLKYLKDSYGDVDLEDLKRFITRQFYDPLAFQPWLKDEAVAKIVGPCKECPPTREDLFGKVKEGQCTDLRCWGRKMKAYLAWRKEQEPELALVTTAYGKAESEGVLSQSNYEMLSTKKKEHCDFAQKALVVEGENIGTTVWICADGNCKDHHASHRDYAPSAKEKEKRKKEREREAAKKDKFDSSVLKALDKVKWPLSEKHLDALLDVTFGHVGTSFQMPVAKRHALQADKKKTSYGMNRDYEAPLRRLADEGGKDAKLRLIFELLLPTYNRYGDSKELDKRISKF